MPRNRVGLYPEPFEKWKTLSVSAEVKRQIEALAPRLGLSQNETVGYAMRLATALVSRREQRKAERKAQAHGR